jgi:hypothetical protein
MGTNRKKALYKVDSVDQAETLLHSVTWVPEKEKVKYSSILIKSMASGRDYPAP